jgi:DNA-binding TFAR19-related protein (PDSD5 family)
VYRARDLRHRLAVIRTDHKSLMQQIERLLTQLAAVKVSETGLFVRAKT